MADTVSGACPAGTVAFVPAASSPDGLDQRLQSTSEALLKLADRCEAAWEPDREIDAAIAVALKYGARGLLPDDLEYLSALRKDDYRDGCPAGGYWFHCRSGKSFRTSSPYTASVDCALTLVPTGRILRKYDVSRFVPHSCEVAVDWAHGGWIGNSDHSFPLALCAAALRAQEASLAKSTPLSSMGNKDV